MACASSTTSIATRGSRCVHGLEPDKLSSRKCSSRVLTSALHPTLHSDRAYASANADIARQGLAKVPDHVHPGQVWCI